MREVDAEELSEISHTDVKTADAPINLYVLISRMVMVTFTGRQ